MKILTRTTTVRLLPDVYERVLFIAHEERKHPTSVMRDAITSTVLNHATTPVPQRPEVVPFLPQTGATASARPLFSDTQTDAVRAVGNPSSNRSARDVYSANAIHSNNCSTRT